MKKQTYINNYPNEQGFFGEYGGRFVPPQLEEKLENLATNYLKLQAQPSFQSELQKLYQEYAGRPSLLYYAKRLSEAIGGAQIYLKREDLNHTGAHKINNTLGQALVARHLGYKKLIAETGAGQHGVATATVAAYFGMECEIYMGQRDIVNQAMNVQRMELLGAKVIPVTQGQATLKDAVDAALVAFIEQPETYYMLGSAVGPHPYPLMVRNFQKIIGQEVREQALKQFGRLPDYLLACVGGGSNALGLFTEFVDEPKVVLRAVEPAGLGAKTNRHGLALGKGKPGVIHGFHCLVLQDEAGEIQESYSAASGLDYPGVGPELCFLAQKGRLELSSVTDQQAALAMVKLAQTEGIICALESAHAVAEAMRLARELPADQIIVVNLSGRGDKDVQQVVEKVLPQYGITLSYNTK